MKQSAESVWSMAFDFVLDNIQVVLQQTYGSTLKVSWRRCAVSLCVKFSFLSYTNFIPSKDEFVCFFNKTAASLKLHSEDFWETSNYFIHILYFFKSQQQTNAKKTEVHTEATHQNPE